MNPRRTLQENESALRKVLTQRTLEALSKQNVAFVLEHQNDTLEQAQRLFIRLHGHSGARPSVDRGARRGLDRPALRRLGTARCTASGQTGYDDAQEPPRVQDTQLVRNEYDRAAGAGTSEREA